MNPGKRKTTSQMLVKDFQVRSKKCHEYVRRSFLSEQVQHEELRKALEYYFSYWNDFTHPGLFSIASEAAGGKIDNALKPQAAMAMMAAAFDIHDDIIDGSKRKHDHTTVFGKYGQDISILLGDAFLIKGFSLLGDAVAELAPGKEKQIFTVVKKCLFEVGNAHALELDMRGKFDVSSEMYFHVLEMKGSSIEADMHVAALLADAPKSTTVAMKEYGRIIGILATLREEFVDIFEVEELNRRVLRETLPLPLILALEESKSKDKIMKLIKKGRITSKDVDNLANVLFDLDSVVGLKKKMEKLSERATVLVYEIGDTRTNALLVSLAKTMLEDL